MAKDRRDQRTHDLFEHERLFPVETPRELENALDFNARISQAIKRALDEAKSNGTDRHAVAARMSDILGIEISKAMIDAYTSQARETHTISLARFKALVRATGCLWLWNVVLEGDGVTLLQGDEARLAQAALAEKRGRALLDEAKRLKSLAPIQINHRRGTK